MLTIDYIHGGSEHCPMIRLFDFEASDVALLRDVCLELGAGSVREVCLDSQSWVRAIGGCRLTLRAGAANRGVRMPDEGGPFVMEYTREGEGWLEVADKLAPFAEGRATGYSWLTTEGDVNVLISWDGSW